MVTELGDRLVTRGHSVTILCDGVIDPTLYPRLKVVCRRPELDHPNSHRLIALRRWAQQALRSLPHEVSLSFCAAIPATLVCPCEGWIQLRLEREDRALNDGLRRLGIQLHPNVIERRLVERAVRRDPRVRGFLALSQTMADDLSVSPGVEERFVRVRGASPIEPPAERADLDSWRDATRRRFGIRDEDTVFLWAGSNGLRHGRSTMLEAVTALVRSGVDSFVVLIAGEGQWSAHDRAMRQSIERQVRVLGRTDEMARLWAAVDVGLAPANHSTLGRVVWESLAFGRPVIATHATGAVDQLRVDDGRLLGRIVRPGDAEALAGAMRDLLDANRYERIARLVTEHASEFEFDRFVTDIERTLERFARADDDRGRVRPREASKSRDRRSAHESDPAGANNSEPRTVAGAPA